MAKPKNTSHMVNNGNLEFLFVAEAPEMVEEATNIYNRRQEDKKKRVIKRM
jgi:hypothetical protein